MNNAFKYHVGTITCLLVMAGCTSFPRTPQLETPQGRECLRACQKKYNQWTRQCTGNDIKAPSRESCLDDCMEDLGKCYMQCSEEENNERWK